MLKRGLLRTALAGVLALPGAASAIAQNYEGDHVVRFGLFAQPAFANFGQTRPVSDSTSASGVLGGVSAGIDWHPHKHWLWGIEFDAAVGDARGDVNTTVGVTNYGIDFLANLRGRFGVYAEPHWLIYGTAGVSFLGIEAGAPQLSGTKAAETLAGLTVGVGTEYKWHHVSLFGEYNFANYASREFTLGTVRHEVDADVHTVRVGIKFNVGHDFGRFYDPGK